MERGDVGGREGGEKKRRIGGGKEEKSRALELIHHASCSTAKGWLQSGREGGLGFTDAQRGVDVCSLAGKTTISRDDRRKSRLTEHPQCSVRLQNVYMRLFQQQNEAERREKEVICSVEIQSDLHSHLWVCIHMEIIELLSSGEKAST